MPLDAHKASAPAQVTGKAENLTCGLSSGRRLQLCAAVRAAAAGKQEPQVGLGGALKYALLLHGRALHQVHT